VVVTDKDAQGHFMFSCSLDRRCEGQRRRRQGTLAVDAGHVQRGTRRRGDEVRFVPPKVERRRPRAYAGPTPNRVFDRWYGYCNAKNCDESCHRRSRAAPSCRERSQ
jgi:hypothetical protein